MGSRLLAVALKAGKRHDRYTKCHYGGKTHERKKRTHVCGVSLIDVRVNIMGVWYVGVNPSAF